MTCQCVPIELVTEVKTNSLEKIKYFKKIDRLVICDHSKLVKLYKLENEHGKEQLKLAKELKGHSGPILNTGLSN